MFKLFFIMTLAVYAVAIPLDDAKSPPKDGPDDAHLVIEQQDPVKHKLQKRLDVASSSHALAEKEEKEEKEKEKDKSSLGDEPHHLYERDTTQTKSDQERKTRDVSGQKDQPDNSKKDQHRNARDTQKKDEKPKREAPEPSSHDPRTQQQPSKPIQKRDTGKNDSTHDPKKQVATTDDENTRHTRSTQEQNDKKDPDTQHKSITKRETTTGNNGKDTKPSKDSKKPQ